MSRLLPRAPVHPDQPVLERPHPLFCLSGFGDPVPVVPGEACHGPKPGRRADAGEALETVPVRKIRMQGQAHPKQHRVPPGQLPVQEDHLPGEQLPSSRRLKVNGINLLIMPLVLGAVVAYMFLILLFRIRISAPEKLSLGAQNITASSCLQRFVGLRRRKLDQTRLAIPLQSLK